MTKPASQTAWQEGIPADVAGREERIAPAPRVSVQAFCETVETAAAIQAAGEDRRMAKAHLRIQMGGLIAAIEAYQNSPTPNVIILESENRGDDILNGLDQLAPVCDASTRVIIIGRMNDVALYRELVRRGVSDYLIAPVGALQVVRSVCGLFSAPDAKPVGRIIAVVGAKGGVGASTIAHNIAFSVARDLVLDSVVTDLDLAFGYRRPRFQPGSAARHCRGCVLARPHRQCLYRPAAVEMHRPFEPPGGAGDAGPRLRFRRRRVRVDLRFAACDRALRRP
jgi:pilus assembly protein CpaE